MKGYFFGLLATCLFCGLCGLVSPEGSLHKYIRLFGGIIILCVMLAPLPAYLQELELSSFFPELSTGEEKEYFDEIYHSSLQQASQKQLEDFLKNRLLEALSLEEAHLEVQLSLTQGEQGATVTEALVTLRGKGILADPDIILKETKALFDCPCVIVYD